MYYKVLQLLNGCSCCSDCQLFNENLPERVRLDEVNSNWSFAAGPESQQTLTVCQAAGE